jgi:hypothetical protein
VAHGSYASTERKKVKKKAKENAHFDLFPTQSIERVLNSEVSVIEGVAQRWLSLEPASPPPAK